MQPEKEFMNAAIEQARNARKNGDYAIGAVIVKDGHIIAKSGNRVKLDEDPTNHAEVVAIRNAAKLLGTRKLNGCTLYTTHEPCPMCSGAIAMARISGMVYGAAIDDMKDYASKHGTSEYSWTTIEIPAVKILEKNPAITVQQFMREECKKLFHNTK